MRRYVIVGNGVAGITAAQGIARADAGAETHVYGAEPYPYYSRPRLWEFLAGEVAQDDLYFRPLSWYAEQGIQVHTGAQVTALDPAEHRLKLDSGETMPYDRLLLATGGRSFVPPFPGANQAGVFALRTLDDALTMKSYARDVQHAIVIGGGLLGLETARALLSAGLDVIVLEIEPRLLPRQLDAEGAQVLQSLLERMGLRFITAAFTETILGDARATGVRLKDGRVIDGEFVLVSAGMRSQVDLARQAGLEVGRGVVVDENLRTSAPDVFAAGDVAEHKGIVYGIIPAATQQAQAAASNMVSGGSTVYGGTVPSTTLKVVGADLTSIGQATDEGPQYTIVRYVDQPAGVYKRLTLLNGQVVGAILLGDVQSIAPVRQLIASGRDVSAQAEQLLQPGFDLKALARGESAA